MRHLRYAARLIRRQPGFSLAVILTFALAIGANTAIFSFVHALLLKPFPFRDPDQLVEIHSLRGGEKGKLSMREIVDIREQAKLLESLAAYNDGGGGYNYSGEGHPEEWRAVLTTGNLFEVLGVPLQAGHKWNTEFDEKRNFGVVLSHGVWQRRFGGRRDVLGKKIALDFAAFYDIYGVAGPSFDYPSGIDVYRSIGGFASYDRRDRRNVVGVARMRPGVSTAQFQSQLDSIAQRLAEQFPGTNAGMTMRAISLRDQYSGNVRPYLWLLMGAVAFVLLIACGNVVNLLLSRAIARDREMAVRVALGAGRRDLLTQLLAESCLLAVVGGALGVLLAFGSIKVLRSLVGAELPRWLVIELDAVVLLFTLLISLGAGLLAGLAPALQWIRESLAEALKEGSRGSSGGRRAAFLRNAMIAGAVALAVLLLAGTTTLVRAFDRLQSQETGFRASQLQTFRVALGWRRYADHKTVVPYFERAMEKISAIPGVHSVAIGDRPPLARAKEDTRQSVVLDGQSATDAQQNPYVTFHAISENYFELLRIPIRQGRALVPFDREGRDRVCLVSERLAKRLWPGQDPVGKRLRHGRGEFAHWWTVVGVAGNTQHAQLGGDWSLDLYVSYRQWAVANQYILARTTLRAEEFEQRAQQAMWSIDPEQSVFDFVALEQRILDGIWQLRFSRLLLVLFSFVALVLAAIGIYGVMSHLVAQRQREIGIRLALGASPSAVRRSVVAQGARLGLIGFLVGTAGSFLAAIPLRALPGVDGLEWLSLAVPALVLAAAIWLACYLPAWRASQVDPAITLRNG